MSNFFWRRSATPQDEARWALGRFPDRTYVHRSFRLNLPYSRDYGQSARYVVKVFDEPEEQPRPGDTSDGLEWTEEVVRATRRSQLKVQIARKAGEVRELVIQRVTTTGGDPRIENVLTLDRDGAGRLVDVMQALNYIPVEGDETVRLDDQTLRDFFADPDALVRLYGRDPEKFRDLIRNDASAQDVVALAHRKRVVERFGELLSDQAAFDQAASTCRGPEDVWQRFLEENPWILGVSLAGQLLTSWDDSKLEQVVAGFSIADVGKRTDALLRTTGHIRSFVFAEIKHHKTELLDRRKEYRPGCWAPSTELAGGVIQVQQTLHLAARQIGDRLAETDESGADTGEATYLIRPRSFLILGHLDQLRGPQGGVHRPMHRSFELYRRNLYEPEIITFDELLARAQWHVAVAERQGNAEDETGPPWDDDIPF